MKWNETLIEKYEEELEDLYRFDPPIENGRFTKELT